jgi:hypothetical protein
VALGQSKMVVRPVAGFLHIVVYAGFVIINIEVLEIIIDGIFGTHRVLSFLGGFYNFLIGSFEILAVLTWLGCAIFLARRFIMRIKRFWSPEMTAWPRTDAALILTFEILLMSAFLLMNAADHTLQSMGAEHYVVAGAFPMSAYLAQLFNFGSLAPSTRSSASSVSAGGSTSSASSVSSITCRTASTSTSCWPSPTCGTAS